MAIRISEMLCWICYQHPLENCLGICGAKGIPIPVSSTSKRIIGSISIGLGIAMKVGIYLFAIYSTINDPATAQGSATSLIILGGGLLGIDTFKPKK